MASMLTKSDYQDVIRRIYDNGYFTNHGPLAQEFESALENYLSINNVVAIGNESLAILIALAGLELRGPILTSALGAEPVARAARWLNLPVRYCDVDLVNHQPTADQLMAALDEDIAAVCLVEAWGNRLRPELIEIVTQIQRPLVVISFDSFGSVGQGQRCEPHENVVSVFGFGPDQLLCTDQGGGIATNNSDWAERFRNVRSSYGTRQRVPVTATCNGRFSEWQAGVGLKSLERLERTLYRRRELALAYDSAFSTCGWATPFSYPDTEQPSYQQFPIMVADPMVAVFRKAARRWRLHDGKELDHQRCSKFPHLAEIARRVFLLPFERNMTPASALELAEQWIMQA